MNKTLGKLGQTAARIAACTAVAALLIFSAHAQTKSFERPFPQSKTEVEKAVAKLHASLSGHLPVLDGFADAVDHPLDRFQRGFYQAEMRVSSTANGGSMVHVTAKVTAWYADPAAAHSGYELLVSNGRIESDLLDQLAEQLTASPGKANDTVAVSAPPASATPIKRSTESRSDSDSSAISAPSPQFPRTNEAPGSSLSQGLASSLEHSGDPAGKNDPSLAASKSALQAEAESLEEALKNLAHPKNLVAVKKSGTPVVATPSLTAKPEFLASKHDEFELLNFTADWVHLRISGLSRGWIWRNSVEMPEGISDTKAAPVAAMKPVEDLFRVTREETAQFPGDWEQLRNKNVKILTVQPADDAATGDSPNSGSKTEGSKVDATKTEAAKTDGTKERLDYAKFLLEKSYAELAANPQGLAGIVVIFDSTDGGMIAAPIATLQQWKTGALTDSALWHKCFFDPPELLDSAPAARGQ
jgi:hypothetical protein